MGNVDGRFAAAVRLAIIGVGLGGRFLGNAGGGWASPGTGGRSDAGEKTRQPASVGTVRTDLSGLGGVPNGGIGLTGGASQIDADGRVQCIRGDTGAGGIVGETSLRSQQIDGEGGDRGGRDIGGERVGKRRSKGKVRLVLCEGMQTYARPKAGQQQDS